ncbi:MAG: bacterioferritin [Actinomycetota bacterium]|nr:bacterioferritin [Actinomycetota bacterium]
MQGDPRVVEILNEVLTNELTATNQYYLHYAMQKNWGFTRLADTTYSESIDEMKHADLLIHRILFLEGHPNLQRLDPLRIGETVREQFEADRAVEVHAMDALHRGITICGEARDVTTRHLFEEILRSEEEHVDYLETQLSLMTSLGEQQYLALQVEPGHGNSEG